MPRRYRVETYSGDIYDVEIYDKSKHDVVIKLPGYKGEILVRIKKIKDDKNVYVEIDNTTYKVLIDEDGVKIDDEASLIKKVVELIPIGIRKEVQERRKQQVVAATKGEVRAPLTGRIVELKVKVGDRVNIGDVVALMESMKMITEIKSDVDGVVEEIMVQPGQAVNRGKLLMRIKISEEKE